MTSRPEEYRYALQPDRLDNTAVIELRPVRPAAAAAYLLRGQAGPSRQRWEQLAAYLRQNPDSVVARALDTPLTLSLARDAYAGGDPAVLADPGKFLTVESLREHLIDQVLVAAYPDEHQRVHATRWLAWIAQHMGTSRDLLWWNIPTWIPRWQLRLAAGLAAGLVSGLVSGLWFGLCSGCVAWRIRARVRARVRANIRPCIRAPAPERARVREPRTRCRPPTAITGAWRVFSWSRLLWQRMCHFGPGGLGTWFGNWRPDTLA